MEAPLKELDKLNKLVSDEPSMGKSKTPAIQDSLNSLLQTLHMQKKRLEAGLATEAELTMLARTVEARKKEIDERQKEIYNSLARYGKTLDKVGLWMNLWGQRLTACWYRDLRRPCRLMNLSLHPKMPRALWNMSLLCTSSGRGDSLLQRRLCRYTLQCATRDPPLNTDYCI